MRDETFIQVRRALGILGESSANLTSGLIPACPKSRRNSQEADRQIKGVRGAFSGVRGRTRLSQLAWHDLLLLPPVLIFGRQRFARPVRGIGRTGEAAISKNARAVSLSKPKMKPRSLPLVLAECGRSAAREGLPLGYSDLQRQAAGFRSGYRTRAWGLPACRNRKSRPRRPLSPQTDSVWSLICCGENQNCLISRRLCSLA